MMRCHVSSKGGGAYVCLCCQYTNVFQGAAQMGGWDRIVKIQTLVGEMTPRNCSD